MNYTPTFGIRADQFLKNQEWRRKLLMAESAPSLKLSKTNYRVWSMTMEVYLDLHNLWQRIIGENASKKKDHQALSAIISGVLEDLLGILDAKKTSKENWEILHKQNLGVDRVIQSPI